MQTNIGERSFLKMIMQMIAHDRLSRIMNRITGYAGNENDGQCKRQSALQSSLSCHKNIFLKYVHRGLSEKEVFWWQRDCWQKERIFSLFQNATQWEKIQQFFMDVFFEKQLWEYTKKKCRLKLRGWPCRRDTRSPSARCFSWGLCSFALSM